MDYAKQRHRDRYLKHRCKKIFYSGENVRPNFNFPGSIEHPRYSVGKCDFAFTFDYMDDPRNYRLPLWALWINWFNVPYNEARDQAYLVPLQHLYNKENVLPKTKFCNFVFSNMSGERVNILDKISAYKRVDCAGSLRNNLGWKIPGRGDQKHKIDFIKDYKFTIAAENSFYPGYTTEKILHPLSVGSIPIYWGSLEVVEDFNPKAFIQIQNQADLDNIGETVKKIDNDEDLYNQYLREPIFKNNSVPYPYTPRAVLEFFEENILC